MNINKWNKEYIHVRVKLRYESFFCIYSISFYSYILILKFFTMIYVEIFYTDPLRFFYKFLIQGLCMHTCVWLYVCTCVCIYLRI